MEKDGNVGIWWDMEGHEGDMEFWGEMEGHGGIWRDMKGLFDIEVYGWIRRDREGFGGYGAKLTPT